MGWANFLGGLAADAAREYVNRKGIDGMMEDMGAIKNKVSNMFSGNDDDDEYDDSNYEDDYQESSGDFWETVDEFVNEKDFDGAESYVQSYCGNGRKDDFFYYAMAYIYNLKAVYYDSVEEERKAKNFITNAVNMLEGDSEWRQSVYSLKKSIDDNLNAFRKEREEVKQAQKEWEKVTSLFNLDSDCSGADAITALEEYYSSRNEERDIFYHKLVYLGYEKLILKENDPLECYYDEMKVKVGIVSDIARSNPEEYGELAQDLRESFLFWENVHYEDEVHELINAGNLSKAYEIAQKLINDEARYTRVITRVESLRLLDMVTNGNPSEFEVKQKIQAVEDVMKRACQLEEDKETSEKIRAAAEERIATAKQYLAGKGSSQQRSSFTQTAPSNAESEYIEELKACYEDGIITDKERRLLDRLRKSLGISPERANQIEKMVVK